ncbi:MAG TPA: DUF6788 family protein [Thermomicrobiaceae bacterium]|nr:DUF6788 family protein [Thermomicrobiaceae bacterium]
MQPDPAQRQEARQIATELARIARSADVLPGTITQRHTRCGKPNCACHHDPPRLHGPYWHWTRKIANKTAGRYLKRDQAEQSQRWIDNDRRLRELLARLEAIGIARLEADQQH